MSISLDTNRIDIPEKQHLDTIELSCLDEKIQRLMHKIVYASDELKEVEARLREIKPEPVNEQELISFGFSKRAIEFLKTPPQDPQLLHEISKLEDKKEAFQTLLDANHRCLAHYEQQLKHCTEVFHKTYPSYKIDQISAAQAEINERVGNIHNETIDLPQKGIGLMETVSFEENQNRFLSALQARSQRIFEKAMTCQAIKTLYIEAMMTGNPSTGQTGPWCLQLLPNASKLLSLGESRGACYFGLRTIVIESELSDDEILSVFVFELTNAVSTKKSVQVREDAKEGTVTREDFVKRIEEIEFDGTKRHHSIISRAVVEMGWDPSLDTYKDMSREFDFYWPIIQKNSHADRYGKQWDRIQSMKAQTILNLTDSSHS